MKKYDPPYIDNEEAQLMSAIDKVDTKKLKRPTKKEQRMFQSAARERLKAEAKMNIRIDEAELERIKAKAAQEGLKYQSFVKSILHKYITGQLVERK